MTQKSHPRQDEIAVLPYLCEATTILGLVIVGELIALVIMLASTPLQGGVSWDVFGMLSMLTQWIMLCSAACLCQLQPVLNRIPPLVSGFIAYLSCLLIAGTSLWFATQYLLVEPSNNWLRAFLISAIIAGILLRYLWLQQQLRYREQAELHARFEALQARIQPHFLFNSMNTIASLIAIDPRAAEKAVEDLSALFRASLKQGNVVSLSQEIELCQRYIAIENSRLGKRLQMQWQLPETLPNLEIPALLLQPLLENAIVHGIQPLKKGGVIVFDLQIQKDCVNINITNPFSENAKASASTQAGNQIAQDNIRHRLETHYGGKANWSAEKNPQTQQYCVELRLPLSTGAT